MVDTIGIQVPFFLLLFRKKSKFTEYINVCWYIKMNFQNCSGKERLVHEIVDVEKSVGLGREEDKALLFTTSEFL